MINPSENEFPNQDPLTAPPPPFAARELPGDAESELSTGERSGSDLWEQTKERASSARERTEFFLRANPVPTIVAALGIGLAIGWALRHATSSEEKEPEIPMRNVNWSFLSLPFLWPFLKSMKDKYEDSADSLKDGVGRLRNIDVGSYTKPIRKRWKAWTD